MSFQSACPLWNTKGTDLQQTVSALFQSTHPQGVRHGWRWGINSNPRISIHVPLTGYDMVNVLRTSVHIQFQSAHPIRDAMQSRKA